jgi:hypothetical protein
MLSRPILDIFCNLAARDKLFCLGRIRAFSGICELEKCPVSLPVWPALGPTAYQTAACMMQVPWPAPPFPPGGGPPPSPLWIGVGWWLGVSKL